MKNSFRFRFHKKEASVYTKRKKNTLLALLVQVSAAPSHSQAKITGP
jgi:hypothetical protein